MDTTFVSLYFFTPYRLWRGLSVRQGIYTRCSLFGVCLGSHGARFPEGGDKSDTLV